MRFSLRNISVCFAISVSFFSELENFKTYGEIFYAIAAGLLLAAAVEITNYIDLSVSCLERKRDEEEV